MRLTLISPGSAARVVKGFLEVGRDVNRELLRDDGHVQPHRLALDRRSKASVIGVHEEARRRFEWPFPNRDHGPSGLHVDSPNSRVDAEGARRGALSPVTAHANGLGEKWQTPLAVLVRVVARN